MAKKAKSPKTKAAKKSKPNVLAAGGLPTSEFQSNIRTAVHTAETKKSKRVSLNPQPIVDAKTQP